VGVLLQRQQSIHLLLATPILVLWWNTEAVLLALGQPVSWARVTIGQFRH
jgi:hypothetical protein